jgi:hypothetical protein
MPRSKITFNGIAFLAIILAIPFLGSVQAEAGTSDSFRSAFSSTTNALADEPLLIRQISISPDGDAIRLVFNRGPEREFATRFGFSDARDGKAVGNVRWFAYEAAGAQEFEFWGMKVHFSELKPGSYLLWAQACTGRLAEACNNDFTLPFTKHGDVIRVKVTAFSDVGGHPHLEAIGYLQERSIVSGYPDGTFRPDAPINRAEFTKIVMGARYPMSEITRFRDHPKLFPDSDYYSWYTNYVHYAAYLGILSGFPDGTFRPNQQVNVAEAAKILANAYGLSAPEQQGPWYRPYLVALTSVNALPTDLRSAGDPLTRGQMAEMIYRLDAGVRHQPSLSADDL